MKSTNTVTKKQLVEKIAKKTRQRQIHVKAAIQEFLDLVKAELAAGNRIELRDFGIFEVKLRAARIARNPKTGQVVNLPPRQRATFKVSRSFLKGNTAGVPALDETCHDGQRVSQRTQMQLTLL